MEEKNEEVVRIPEKKGSIMSLEMRICLAIIATLVISIVGVKCYCNAKDNEPNKVDMAVKEEIKSNAEETLNSVIKEIEDVKLEEEENDDKKETYESEEEHTVEEIKEVNKSESNLKNAEKEVSENNTTNSNTEKKYNIEGQYRWFLSENPDVKEDFVFDNGGSVKNVRQGITYLGTYNIEGNKIKAVFEEKDIQGEMSNPDNIKQFTIIDEKTLSLDGIIKGDDKEYYYEFKKIDENSQSFEVVYHNENGLVVGKPLDSGENTLAISTKDWKYRVNYPNLNNGWYIIRPFTEKVEKVRLIKDENEVPTYLVVTTPDEVWYLDFNTIERSTKGYAAIFKKEKLDFSNYIGNWRVDERAKENIDIITFVGDTAVVKVEFPYEGVILKVQMIGDYGTFVIPASEKGGNKEDTTGSIALRDNKVILKIDKSSLTRINDDSEYICTHKEMLSIFK